MSIIATKNLSKAYIDEETGVQTPVLHDISFAIEKGEFVAIMGPSGSGKSTLLHVLCFLDTYTGGSYRFGNHEASGYAGDDAARVRNEKIGFVFQSFNLLPHSTVLENVMLPLLYSRVPESEWRERAMKAIISVGLEHRANFDSTRLSGGEKQRVAIARALVCSPEIIVADEPTGNLDSKSGNTIMDILQKLNDDLGHTVILVTHETDTAEHARRIIRIKDGMIESDKKVIERRRASDGVLLK